MLDFELLAKSLLTTGMPGRIVLPEIDVGDLSSYPIVMWKLTPGQAIQGSLEQPTAWDCSLDFNVLDESRDGAWAVCQQVYDLVWSWNDAFGTAHIVAGIGHVNEIHDTSIFDRVITASVGDRTITHYAGGFGLEMHSA